MIIIYALHGHLPPPGPGPGATYLGPPPGGASLPGLVPFQVNVSSVGPHTSCSQCSSTAESGWLPAPSVFVSEGGAMATLVGG